MSRYCDAIGCKANVASGLFMCRRHWHMVPRELQRVINKQYRAGRQDFAFLSDVIYLQAAVDAIDKIAQTEGFLSTGPNHPANPYLRYLVGAQRRAQQSGVGVES